MGFNSAFKGLMAWTGSATLPYIDVRTVQQASGQLHRRHKCRE